MSMRDLIPWTRNHVPAPRSGDGDPFLSLRREMDRLFDDFTRGFGMPGLALTPLGAWPDVDVEETDKAFRVTADLPGLEERDVDISVDGTVLTLQGEKRREHDGEDNGVRVAERSYGRFERRIDLGEEVDADKAKAQFRNGVLTVTLPRRAEARRQAKRIPVKGH